jgi:hypothetical protein
MLMMSCPFILHSALEITASKLWIVVCQRVVMLMICLFILHSALEMQGSELCILETENGEADDAMSIHFSLCSGNHSQ